MSDEVPYISVVVTSRNDNHGDRLLPRMQMFLNCLTDQCARHKLPAELVLVEWNPPCDRPVLAEALRWPSRNSYCPVRIIQVPPRIHQRFQNSEKLPLFQMIAKNVGIRRARAPFVLATNIDILFSEELIGYFASRRLEHHVMYRIDRCDVPARLPAELPVEQLLDFCRRNVTCVYKRRGLLNPRTREFSNGLIPWRTMAHQFCSMLLGAGWEKTLHTNASGDFMLMGKSNWWFIRGYAELHMLSINVDGLGCHTAYFAGAREQVLAPPMQIYHIEHSTTPGWVPEGDGFLMAATNPAHIPKLDYGRYRELAVRMRKERRPIIFNDDRWGLSDEGLPEVLISAL